MPNRSQEFYSNLLDIELAYADICELLGGYDGPLELKSMKAKVRARYEKLFREHRAAHKAGHTHKIWRADGGPTGRAAHIAVEGQKVLIDEKFSVDREMLFLPSDPDVGLGNTANCGCEVEYVTEYVSPIPLGTNLPRKQMIAELRKLSSANNIPLRALIALVDAESDFRQYDSSGKPLITSSSGSTAGGLGQVTNMTSDLYRENYRQLLQDWKYNLSVALRVFKAGYDHTWNKNIKDNRVRAARAYGMYHDGFQPDVDHDLYERHPRGIPKGSTWIARYLSYY